MLSFFVEVVELELGLAAGEGGFGVGGGRFVFGEFEGEFLGGGGSTWRELDVGWWGRGE